MALYPLKYCFLILIIGYHIFLLNVLALPKVLPEPILTCYDGFTLNEEKKCVKSISEPPKQVCPPQDGELGKVENGKCRIRLPVLKRCSKDNETQTEDGNCMYTVRSPPKYFCPAGYLDDGTRCSRKTIGEMTYHCPKGTKVGNQCVEILTQAILITETCPSDSNLIDGRCWKSVEVFDCFGKNLKLEERRNGRFASLPLRHLSEQSPPKGIILQKTLSSSSNNVDSLVPVTAPQNFKVRVKSQTCEKLVEVSPIISKKCPDGFMESDSSEKPVHSQCIREIYSPLVAQCSEGHKSSNVCPVRISYVPKQARCLNGFLTRKDICEDTVIVPGTKYCPSNFHVENDSCIGFIDAPLECPNGFLLTSDNLCLGEKVYTPISYPESFPVEN
jgi:hypothetical protein